MDKTEMEKDWKNNPRWEGIVRPYTPEQVMKLRGSLKIEYTLARHGSTKLWSMLHEEKFIRSLGALSGGQALQQVKAGIKAIYVSGWQIAADANTSNMMYPDQSLYPVDSVPKLVERINNTFQRAGEIHKKDYFVPIIADAEAGFGGVLNAFELTKMLIEKGAAGVHLEDQLSSAKKCGHLGGKVMVPTKEAIDKLVAARLAADVMDIPLVIIARTDAESSHLVTSDYDDNDKPFLRGCRTEEGFYYTKAGIDQAISRGLAYAPYADVIWCETGTPNLDDARKFANAIHKQFPKKRLAYNCSPSFHWKKFLDDESIACFQEKIAEMGYQFQFITLAGIHSMWYNMFDLSSDYIKRGMAAYVEKIQEPEFRAKEKGYTFVSHQQEVGTGYFDLVATTILGNQCSVIALQDSTESRQF